MANSKESADRDSIGEPSSHIVEKAARAIDAISERFAAAPSEEAMETAVGESLTGDDAADAIVRTYARNTLALWAASGRAEADDRHQPERRLLYEDKEATGAVVDVVGVIAEELLAHIKRHPEELLKIRPRQFEEIVAEILAGHGWQVQLTPESKDGGYDIFATSRDVAGVTSAWIIECKKYAPTNKVGVEVVRGLYGTQPMLQQGVNALLATTSHFTKGAYEYEASRYDLALKDYEGVLEWINAYKPHPDGKLYIRENRLHLPGDDGYEAP